MIPNRNSYGGIFFLLTIVLWGIACCTYAQEIYIATDRQSIKIGEQIEYEISVETLKEDSVQFPEGQTFMPLEMVRSSAVDTFRKNEKIRLVKRFYLTQFDSGAYIIPQQRIFINGTSQLTDTVLVNVRSVPFDTLQQPLFDIKPITQPPRPKTLDKTTYKIIVLLLCLMATSLGVYWFFFRRKKLAKEEKKSKLPPFEKAIQDLKELQNSRYLIQSQYKEYYSELTRIVIEYIEKEIHISAKENTTNELLDKISLLQVAGKLNLNDEVIKSLKQVLSTADLVKFAKNKPTDTTAENDRTVIENVVRKTKEALPEPSEEDKMKDKSYLEAMKKQQKKRRSKIIIISSVSIFLFVFGIFGTLYGWQNLKNKIIGNYTLELYQGRWVQSQYGFPPTTISTPEVLQRIHMQSITGYEDKIAKQYTFDFGDIHSDLYIFTNIVTFKNENSENPQQKIVLNAETINEFALKQIENVGAENMTTMEEQYTTKSGAKGIKLYGNMTLNNKKGKPFLVAYQLYTFAENNALQQLLITYNAKDDNAKKIAERVVHSLDFKKE